MNLPPPRSAREAAPTHREVCPRCRRPARVCWCAHLTALDTRTRVLLLQHPRERDVPIGTARMASLCLPNAELHVGVDWSEVDAVARALRDPARPAALLFPGDGAIDVCAHPPATPVTLVVIDGTWSQARKVLRVNPMLAALPRYAFTPPEPGQYRIRREPDLACVSTIEALAYVLGALEGDAARFKAMLAPFHAMVDAQVQFRDVLREGRARHPRGPRPPKPPRAAPFADCWERVVCLTAEASAWPRDADVDWPAELVQWIAHRPATGETFERFVATPHPLSPGFAWQTGVDARHLDGLSPPSVHAAAWRRFVRDDDIVCTWGDFPITLLDDATQHLPAQRVDLRKLTRAEAKGPVGSPRAWLMARGLDGAVGDALGEGRAGRRLAEIVAVVQALRS